MNNKIEVCLLGGLMGCQLGAMFLAALAIVALLVDSLFEAKWGFSLGGVLLGGSLLFGWVGIIGNKLYRWFKTN